jgi:hypothetical protein
MKSYPDHQPVEYKKFEITFDSMCPFCNDCVLDFNTRGHGLTIEPCQHLIYVTGTEPDDYSDNPNVPHQESCGWKSDAVPDDIEALDEWCFSGIRPHFLDGEITVEAHLVAEWQESQDLPGYSLSAIFAKDPATFLRQLEVAWQAHVARIRNCWKQLDAMSAESHEKLKSELLARAHAKLPRPSTDTKDDHDCLLAVALMRYTTPPSPPVKHYHPRGKKRRGRK